MFKPDDATSYKRDDAAFSVQVLSDVSCGRPIVAASPAALIAAVAGVGINIAESEIDTYLANKKKQFTATYKAARSGYAFPKIKNSGEIVTANCIRILRTVKENGSKVNAFEAYFLLQTDGSGTAQRLVPTAVTLSRAAALTDNSTRKVDFTVEIKIDAFGSSSADNSGTGSPSSGKSTTKGLSTIVDHTFDFPGLQTPGGNSGRPNASKTIYNCATAPSVTGCQDFSDSGWFPAITKVQTEVDRCSKDATCVGVTPFNFTVLVTETGSGADGFGTIQADISNNKSSLNSAIVTYIQQALGK